MQSQVNSIQAVQKTVEEQTRVEDVPVDTQRLMPTMQKVQNTQSGELREDFSGAVHRRDCQRSQ